MKLLGFYGIQLSVGNEYKLLKELKIRANSYDKYGFLRNDYKDLIGYRQYDFTRTTNKSMEQLSIESAQRLKDCDTIYLLFSGGIDSCAVLSSIILAGLVDKVKLLVYKPTFENEEIVTPIIQRYKISILYFDDNEIQTKRDIIVDKDCKWNENICVVVGDGGEYIPVSDWSFKEGINPTSNYEDYFSKELSVKSFETLQKWINCFPFSDKIKTVHQLGWLLCSAIQNTHFKYIRHFMMNKQKPNQHISFWDNMECHDYMITHLDDILYGTPWIPSEYKKEYKGIISKVFGNALDNYPKINSHYKTVLRNTIISNYVATDGVRLYTKNELDYARLIQHTRTN